jgi:hypothetical protein
MDPAGKWKVHDAGVVDKDDNDRKRAEQIEAGLAFALGEARIDAGVGSLFGNGANVAGAPAQSRKQTRLNEKPAADALRDRQRVRLNSQDLVTSCGCN